MPDFNHPQTITLTSQCLCKSHSFSTSIPTSSLPLDASCCHCTSCRHSTGGLYTMDIDWPGDHSPILSSSLRRYDFTDRVKVLWCGTCGTPMFFEGRYEGPDGPVTLGVFSGTLGNVGVQDLVRITDHIFVGDTDDGGASVWLRRPNGDGSEAKRYKAGKGSGSGMSEELGENWPGLTPGEGEGKRDGKTEVPLWCKCRGVDLVLKPDFEAWPADKELPFFVDPETKKLLASFDACDSCRIAMGSDVVYWTFALLEHIYFKGEGETLPTTAKALKEAVSRPEGERDKRLGTLKMFESSDGVQRYFCGGCSATVFYACDGRQDMVDIAVGVLESEKGARAEDVLTWSLGGKMTWRDDVKGGWREGLIGRIEEAAEEFRVRRGIEKSFRRKIKEAAEEKKG